MERFYLLTFWWALFFLVGCDDDAPKETHVAETTVDCGEPKKTPLAPDDATPAGTPKELSEWINGEQVMPVKWFAYELEDESSSAIDASLTIYISTTPDGANLISYPSKKKACNDRLEITGMVSFHTSDGIFREEFGATVTRIVSTSEQAKIESTIPLDQISGQYDFSPMYTKYNEPTLYFEATATPKITDGKLSVSHKHRTTASTLVAEFHTN